MRGAVRGGTGVLACRRRRRRQAGRPGARDTLRLESGLPLHGHELGAGITPLQAGLGWVVSWDKGPFRGREALERSAPPGSGAACAACLAMGADRPVTGMRSSCTGRSQVR